MTLETAVKKARKISGVKGYIDIEVDARQCDKGERVTRDYKIWISRWKEFFVGDSPEGCVKRLKEYVVKKNKKKRS